MPLRARRRGGEPLAVHGEARAAGARPEMCFPDPFGHQVGVAFLHGLPGGPVRVEHLDAGDRERPRQPSVELPLDGLHGPACHGARVGAHGDTA